MAAGETLVKFTDYPFAYSIVALIMGVAGFSFTQNQFLFLGIAGAFGTLLVVVDPVGGLIRNREKKFIQKNSKDSDVLPYKLSALKTKAITFEIEKILGLFYFVFSIFGFMIAITIPSKFFEKLILKDIEGNPLVDELLLKFIFLIVSAIVMLILAFRARKFWNELDNEIDIAAYHLIAINDDNATQTSLQNMTRAIEQNDWTLADLWKGKITDEIKYKKGKRDLIIKAADLVFSPLHKESNDFKINDAPADIPKRPIQFSDNEWNNIKQFSHQSIIEDTSLRQRITSFYNKVNDYNEKFGPINRRIIQIIENKMSSEFGKSVSNIRYEIVFEKGSSNIDLISCIFSDIHPLNFYGPLGTPSYLEMTHNGTANRTAVAEDLEKFDIAWKKILDEIKSDPLIQNFHKIHNEVVVENNKLMNIYSEKIEMQWNV